MPSSAEIEARLRQRTAFLESDQENPNLLAECIDLNLLLGRFEEAGRLVNSALAISPEDPYFKARQASVFLGKEDFTSAVAVLKRLIDAGHSAAAVRYNLAYACARTAQFEQSEEQLVFLEHDPGNMTANAAALLVRVRHHLGKLDEAVNFGERFMDGHPEDSVIPGLLAVLHHDLNNSLKASEWANKALAINPANPEGLYTTGVLALEQEDINGAENKFRDALSINPRSGRAWLGMGLSKLYARNLSEARQNLQSAVEWMPNHIGTWHALAWCQILQGDVAAAKGSFLKALDLDRNFGETHGGLAVIAIMEGQPEEARQAAARAVKLQPESFSGRFAQLLLLQKSGRNVNTAAMIDKMLSAYPVPSGGTLKDMLNRVVRSSASRQSDLH